LEYKESLVPLGENPLDVAIIYDGWASPDDCDYNMHLSNSSYPKTLDSARFKFAITMFPPFLDQGGNIFLGGTQFNFIREIPIGSRYQIRMKLLAWDSKWMYVAGQFVIPPKHPITDIKGKGKSKPVESLPAGVREALGKQSTSNGVVGYDIEGFVAPNLTGTPATPSGSNTPAESTDTNDSGSSSVPSSSSGKGGAQRPLPQLTKDGWTVCCTSLSILCCKQGRSTVPPSLALAVSGLMAHGKEEWNTLKRMRASGETKRLLKGGWRDVKADSESIMGNGAWWEDVMRREGVMDEVEKRMQGGLAKARECMEFVGSVC